jgi:ABC-type transport system involved in cytochrome c biogenesis permease subunit
MTGLFEALASVFYFGSMAGIVASIAGLIMLQPTQDKRHRLVQFSLDGVAVALLVGVFVFRSLAAGHFALTNMYESVLAVTLGLYVSRYLIDPRLKSKAFHLGAMGLGLIALGASLKLPREIPILQPALMSYWRSIHVPIIMLSYSLMFLASITAMLFLVQRQEDKKHHLLGLMDKTVTFAVPVLAIGVALGAVWANEAWGTYWNWDPKENMALATLFIYGAYLHLRLNTEVSATALSYLLIAGFVVLMLTYIGINLLGVGLHSYGNFMAG